MYTILVILHVLASVAIIAIVLLQSGKGADIGSAFGGGGSQTVFGSMGASTVLTKATIGVAVAFMLTAFGLTMVVSRRPASVIPATKAEQPARPPQVPAQAPAPSGGQTK